MCVKIRCQALTLRYVINCSRNDASVLKESSLGVEALEKVEKPAGAQRLRVVSLSSEPRGAATPGPQRQAGGRAVPAWGSQRRGPVLALPLRGVATPGCLTFPGGRQSSPSGRVAGPVFRSHHVPFYRGHLAFCSRSIFQTSGIYRDKTGLLRGA